MRIRVSKEVYKALKLASEDHNISMSDIWRRALRFWRKANGIDSAVVGLSDFKSTTKNEIVLSPDIPAGLIANRTPDELRFILAWYLHKKAEVSNIPRAADYMPYAIEGIDYNVPESDLMEMVFNDSTTENTEGLTK